MEVSHISKSYSDRVLFRDVSFFVQKGMIALIGKSGTGKSTFLKVLIGEEKPDDGRIECSSENPCFSYSGCDYDTLIVDFSLEENYKALFGSNRFSSRTEQLILALHFTDSVKKRIIELSGGERSKANLIIALSKDTDFYCLDEPFQGMDEESRKEAVSFLNEFSKTHLVFLAIHAIEGTGLSPDGIIDFDQKGRMIDFAEKKTKEAETKEMIKSKTSSMPIRSLFRCIPLYSVLLFLMVAFSFLSLSLGISFTEFRSKQESALLSLQQDHFSYHAVSFSEEDGEVTSLLDALSEKGIDSYSFSLDGTASYFYPVLNEDKLLQCSGNRKYASVSYAEDGSTVARQIEYSTDVPVLDCFPFCSVYDGKQPGNLFLCSPSLMEKLLLSETVMVDGQNVFSPLYFAWKEKHGVFFSGLPNPNVKVEKREGISVPFRYSGNMSVGIAENNLYFTSVVTESEDDFVHIGIKEYRFLLLLSGKGKAYCGKAEIEELFSRYPNLKAEDIISDYASGNRVRIVGFALFAAFFLCFLMMLFFSGRILASWKKNLTSFYRLNCLKGNQKKDILFLTLFLSAPFFLFCLLSYLFWLVPVSNGALTEFCYPDGSFLLRCYPEFYGGTIPYLQISWQGILLLLLFFALIFFLLLFGMKPMSKKTK